MVSTMFPCLVAFGAPAARLSGYGTPPHWARTSGADGKPAQRLSATDRHLATGKEEE